jgi:hypothetical protein
MPPASHIASTIVVTFNVFATCKENQKALLQG